MYKGVALTARVSLKLLVLEALRRTLGFRYTVNGIKVEDASTFRILRSAIQKGYPIWVERNRYYVRTPYGIISASRASLLGSAVNADFDAIYGGDYSGKKIADIGGYIGETALYFLARGASLVRVYEPVFWQEAEFNLKGLSAIVYPYGVWWDRRKISVFVEDSMTGLRTGELEIETVPLVEAAEGVDVVKMNCEGCEYSLLLMDCESILERQWIVEVHGPEPVIMEKFRDCGLRPRVITRTQTTSVIRI